MEERNEKEEFLQGKKENPRIKSDKIKRIGGEVYSYYYRLDSQRKEINDAVLRVWKILKLGESEPVELFIRTAERGIYELKGSFLNKEVERLFKQYEEGNPEAKEMFQKYKKPEKVVRTRSGKKFDEIAQRERRVLSNYMTGRISRLFEYFKEAFFLDPEEGLSIDGEKYLQIYEDLTKAQTSKDHEKHEKAVEALNKFFGKSRVEMKDFERYFVIKEGKVCINPKSENVRSYMRLHG